MGGDSAKDQAENQLCGKATFAKIPYWNFPIRKDSQLGTPNLRGHSKKVDGQTALLPHLPIPTHLVS